MAGNVIYQSTIANNLKLTLDEIVDDKTDGLESSLVMPKYFTEGTMRDAYVDDLETAGPSLVPLKPEGTELELGAVREGQLVRYTARTWGMKLIISDEAKEDYKYPEVTRLAGRLKRAMFKTIDYEAATFPARGWNAAYPMADGQPLFSASHTLPNGGTYSNTAGTPTSPSVASVALHRAAVMKLPGHDGLIEGYDLEKVCFPTEQWQVWGEILGSQMRPDANNFAAINVIKPLGIEPVGIKYWTNTTTNYFYVTDAPDGLKWKWRRRPKGKTWVDNDQEVEKFGISARWANGCSDFRGVYGVQA